MPALPFSPTMDEIGEKMTNLRYLSNPELVFDNKGGSIFNDKTGSVLPKKVI
jgi:hypothetical protein